MLTYLAPSTPAAERVVTAALLAAFDCSDTVPDSTPIWCDAIAAMIADDLPLPFAVLLHLHTCALIAQLRRSRERQSLAEQIALAEYRRVNGKEVN